MTPMFSCALKQAVTGTFKQAVTGTRGRLENLQHCGQLAKGGAGTAVWQKRHGNREATHSEHGLGPPCLPCVCHPGWVLWHCIFPSCCMKHTDCFAPALPNHAWDSCWSMPHAAPCCWCMGLVLQHALYSTLSVVHGTASAACSIQHLFHDAWDSCCSMPLLLMPQHKFQAVLLWFGTAWHDVDAL